VLYNTSSYLATAVSDIHSITARLSTMFLTSDVNHHDDQDERALNTTPSSTYIPLSDDNPTPQDTDDVHDD